MCEGWGRVGLGGGGEDGKGGWGERMDLLFRKGGFGAEFLLRGEGRVGRVLDV